MNIAWRPAKKKLEFFPIALKLDYAAYILWSAYQQRCNFVQFERIKLDCNHSYYHDYRIQWGKSILTHVYVNVRRIIRELIRVFSLNFWWGAQNFRSPSVPDGDEVGWGGGGTCKKIQLKPKINCPLNAKLGHFLLSYANVVSSAHKP